MMSAKMERRSGRGSEGPRGRTRPNRYEKLRTTEGGRMSKAEPQLLNSDCVKLFVRNLDKGVTEEDVIELFRKFESFKTATLYYDRYNSRGTAEVVYDRKRGAVEAMKEYNNVPLDGKPMEIAIERETAQASQPARREGRTKKDNLSKKPKSRKNRSGGVMKEDKGGAMGGWGGERTKSWRFIRKEQLKTEMKAQMWNNQRSRFVWKSNRNVKDEVRGGEKTETKAKMWNYQRSRFVWKSNSYVKDEVRGGGKRSIGSSTKNRKKLVISKEDLDAELDAYMKRGKV